MRKKLGLNSLWLLLARIGTQVLSLAFVALVARQLGPATFGQFSLMAAVVFLGNAITTFGTDTLIMRDIARNGRTGPLVSESLSLQCGLALVWVIGQFVIIQLAQIEPALSTAMLIYSLLLLPLALYTVCSAVLRGIERMDLYLWLTLLGAGLQVFVALGIVLLQGSIGLLALGLLVVQIVVALVGWWVCVRTVPDFKIAVAFNQQSLVGLLRTAAPLSILTGLAILSQRMGLFLVSWLVGNVGAGVFSASTRITDGLKFGHQSVLGALMPGLLKQDAGSAKLFRTALWSMPLAGGGLALLASLVAGPIITLIYGPGYEAAISLLVILSWALIPYAFNAVVSLSLVSHGAESLLAKTTTLSLIVSTLLVAGLIIYAGLTGTAWGMVIGEIIQAALLILAYRTLRPESKTASVPYGL